MSKIFPNAKDIIKMKMNNIKKRQTVIITNKWERDDNVFESLKWNEKEVEKLNHQVNTMKLHRAVLRTEISNLKEKADKLKRFIKEDYHLDKKWYPVKLRHYINYHLWTNNIDFIEWLKHEILPTQYGEIESIDLDKEILDCSWDSDDPQNDGAYVLQENFTYKEVCEMLNERKRDK